MAEHNQLGQKGELLARAFLQEKGYEILEVNWRYQKAELDIVAKFENVLAVVEVKTRSSTTFENPKEAVTLKKQKLIVKAANAYIQEKNIELECRFDIVSILIQNGEVTSEHIEDAFYPLL